MNTAERLLTLFQGNESVRGVHKDSAHQWTEKQGPTAEAWTAHLTGGLGVGVAPASNAKTCLWGALDIDDHIEKVSGVDDFQVDFRKISADIDRLELPLLLCRSKSGSAHAYVFFEKPLPVAAVQMALAVWSEQLGHPRCEIFPKDGGNWLNMPYYEAEKRPLAELSRYCWHQGTKLSVTEFLDAAEDIKLSKRELTHALERGHSEAPPCITQMMSKGISSNDGYYHVAVYLKKAFGSEDLDTNLSQMWETYGHDDNPNQPFRIQDILNIAKSVAKAPDDLYRYKCKTSPMCNMCNIDVCKTKKYGVGVEEGSIMQLGAMPTFGPVTKIETEPPRWCLGVNGRRVDLTTKQIKSWPEVHTAVLDQLTLFMPTMKQGKWVTTIGNLVNNPDQCTVIDAPDEASTRGLIMASLWEYLSIVDRTVDPRDTRHREALKRNAPALQKIADVELVLFTGVGLREHLRHNRRDEGLKPAELWHILSDGGVFKKQVTIGHHNRKVWAIPADVEKLSQFDIPDDIPQSEHMEVF